MSRFRNFLTSSFGEFSIDEGVSKAVIANTYHNIIFVKNNLPAIMKVVDNPKWRDYLERYMQMSVNVAELLEKNL